MYMTLQIGKFTFLLTYRKILTIIYLGKQVSLTNLGGVLYWTSKKTTESLRN